MNVKGGVMMLIISRAMERRFVNRIRLKFETFYITNLRICGRM